jgi:cell filamentation protein
VARKKYADYSYIDPDSEYTYPNSSVLRNKFDIRDADEARAKEYEFVSSRIVKLGFFPIEVNSMKDVLKIHDYLFQDMYEWAGKYRRVNISKSGHAFMTLQAFDTGEEYMDSLIKKFHGGGNSRGMVTKQLADILDNLNYMHPFREGNGRTQREAIRSLALTKGYRADIDVDIDDEIYRLYMDGTVYGDMDKLVKLFEMILEEEE